MQAKTLATLEEHTIGTEDRVFLSDSGWFWQLRGTNEAAGPFKTKEEAIKNYDLVG